MTFTDGKSTIGEGERKENFSLSQLHRYNTKLYHCTRVKLIVFRVYIENLQEPIVGPWGLTVSSQEPPKKKSKRDNGLFFCAPNAHAWISCILCQCSPARTIWKNTRLIMAMNHKQKRIRNRWICTTAGHTWTYHMEEATWMLLYI